MSTRGIQLSNTVRSRQGSRPYRNLGEVEAKSQSEYLAGTDKLDPFNPANVRTPGGDRYITSNEVIN